MAKRNTTGRKPTQKSVRTGVSRKNAPRGWVRVAAHRRSDGTFVDAHMRKVNSANTQNKSKPVSYNNKNSVTSTVTAFYNDVAKIKGSGGNSTPQKKEDIYAKYANMSDLKKQNIIKALKDYYSKYGGKGLGYQYKISGGKTNPDIILSLLIK